MFGDENLLRLKNPFPLFILQCLHLHSCMCCLSQLFTSGSKLLYLFTRC